MLLANDSMREGFFFLDSERNARPLLDSSILILACTLPHHIVLAQRISILSWTLLVLNLEADLVFTLLTQDWTYTTDSTVDKKKHFKTL